MSNVPEGARLSDDGQWWWNEENQQWIAVDGGDGGGGAQGSARFAIRDLKIDAVKGGTPSAKEELKAGFQVCNSGVAAGTAEVEIYVDGASTGVKWTSPQLNPGDCAVPDGDGYVPGIAGQSEGSHKFEAWVSPGEPGYDSAANEITVNAPEN